MMRIRFGIVWGITICSAWALGGPMAAAQVNAGRKIAKDLKEKAGSGDEGGSKEKQPATKGKAEPVKGGGVEGFLVGPSEVVKFEIDGKSSRNQVSFVSKAPKETITGKTDQATGMISFNPRKIEDVEGTFAVAWKDVDTGKPMMNKHIQSAPWVDSKSHPEIVFTVTGVEKIKAKGTEGKALQVTLIGTMAMNGKEKEMKIPATLAYVEAKKAGGHDGLGIKATFKVALADFGIKGKPGAIGNSVAAVETCKVSLSLTGPASSDSSAEAKPKKKTKKS